MTIGTIDPKRYRRVQSSLQPRYGGGGKYRRPAGADGDVGDARRAVRRPRHHARHQRPLRSPARLFGLALLLTVTGFLPFGGNSLWGFVPLFGWNIMIPATTTTPAGTTATSPRWISAPPSRGTSASPVIAVSAHGHPPEFQRWPSASRSTARRVKASTRWPALCDPLPCDRVSLTSDNPAPPGCFCRLARRSFRQSGSGLSYGHWLHD